MSEDAMIKQISWEDQWIGYDDEGKLLDSRPIPHALSLARKSCFEGRLGQPKVFRRHYGLER